MIGRRSRFKSEYARMAVVLCELGAIDKDLAEAFGVSERTINTWKVKHPSFKRALDTGKPVANHRVEQALLARAIGSFITETKALVVDGKIQLISIEKHYPPDTKACLSWLANRDPDRWSHSPVPKEPNNGHEDWLDSLDDDDDEVT